MVCSLARLGLVCEHSFLKDESVRESGAGVRTPSLSLARLVARGSEKEDESRGARYFA